MRNKIPSFHRKSKAKAEGDGGLDVEEGGEPEGEAPDEIAPVEAKQSVEGGSADAAGNSLDGSQGEAKLESKGSKGRMRNKIPSFHRKSKAKAEGDGGLDVEEGGEPEGEALHEIAPVEAKQSVHVEGGSADAAGNSLDGSQVEAKLESKGSKGRMRNKIPSFRRKSLVEAKQTGEGYEVLAAMIQVRVGKEMDSAKLCTKSKGDVFVVVDQQELPTAAGPLVRLSLEGGGWTSLTSSKDHSKALVQRLDPGDPRVNGSIEAADAAGNSLDGSQVEAKLESKGSKSRMRNKIPSFRRKSLVEAKGAGGLGAEGGETQETAPIVQQFSLADFTREAAPLEGGQTQPDPVQPMDPAPQQSMSARKLHGISLPKGLGRRRADRAADGGKEGEPGKEKEGATVGISEGVAVDMGDTNVRNEEEAVAEVEEAGCTAEGAGATTQEASKACVAGDTAVSVMEKLEEMVQSTTMLFKQMQQWQVMEEEAEKEAETERLLQRRQEGAAALAVPPVPPPKPAHMHAADAPLSLVLSTSIPETAAVSAELNELSRRRRRGRQLEQQALQHMGIRFVGQVSQRL
jgi:hypothetical protein